MERLKNPFVVQGYQGKDYFCNREHELELLEEHVVNQRNFTLFGWRRLGKTAMLQRLAIELKQKHKIETLFVDISACRSMSEVNIKTIDAVYHQFGKAAGGFKTGFQKLLGSLGLSVGFDPQTGMPEFSLGIGKAQEEKPTIKAVYAFLEEQKTPVLVVFDEFQQITHFNTMEAEAVLREATQQFPGLRFGFCGSHRGIMQAMFASHKRPFYKSTQLVDVSAIELDDYVAFIVQKFSDYGKKIPKELAAEIYAWARGETYTVQVICNRLFAKHNHPKQADFYSTVESLMGEQKRSYTEWFNLLPYNQIQVLKAIAKSEPAESPTSHSFIRKHRLSAPSSVQTALKALTEKEIVFKQEGKYYVHDVLLGKFLKSM